MQLKVWLVRKHPSCLGMQLKYLVYKKLCTLTKCIVLSTVASLLRRKVVMGVGKKELGALREKGREDRERKCCHNAVKSASRTRSTTESSSA